MVNLINKEKQTDQFKPKDQSIEKAEYRSEDQLSASEEKVNLNRYKDPDGLSLRKLEIGLWLSRNKRNFVSLFIGLLIVLIVLSWGSFMANFGIYIFSGMRIDSQLLSQSLNSELMSYSGLKDKKAKDIVASRPIVIDSGSKTDFIVKVNNPNAKHIAHFKYSFNVGGQEYGERNGFILPEETKYLLALGENIPSRVNRAELVLTNVSWERVNKKEIIDWDLYASDRLNIGTREENFIPGQSTGLSENVILNRLEFVAYNNSAYNYYQTDFNIILFQNNTEIGAYKHSVDRFMSGQEKYVDLTLAHNIGNVSKILIEPEIDISQDDIYIDIGEKYK
jgi:hypothetical protein